MQITSWWDAAGQVSQRWSKMGARSRVGLTQIWLALSVLWLLFIAYVWAGSSPDAFLYWLDNGSTPGLVVIVAPIVFSWIVLKALAWLGALVKRHAAR
jgi:hypothetical protein